MYRCNSLLGVGCGHEASLVAACGKRTNNDALECFAGMSRTAVWCRFVFDHSIPSVVPSSLGCARYRSTVPHEHRSVIWELKAACAAACASRAWLEHIQF